MISDTDNTLSFVGTEKTKTGAVNIPATWDDGQGITFKVTKVGGNETYKCEGVTDITLPEGITEIAYGSFGGAKLKTLKIPASVTSISNNAFYRVQELPKVTVDHSNAKFCDDGHGALYSKDKTELYAVPTNADNIPNGTYTVDTAVKKIHHSAFINTSNTPGIKKIILPPHLELVEADYPSCVQLNTLEEYEMPAGASGHYKVIGGVLFKDNALVQYPRNKQEKNYQVPDGITEIGERAFSLCKKLNTITFLCDKMIDPAKINQLDNKRSFDNGSSGTTDMPTNIDIYVRKEQLANYNNEPFYQKFKSRKTSFEVDNLEYLPVSATSVDLLDVKKTDYTFVVPDKVTHDGKTYDVSMIGDYAFQNTTNAVHEVVVKKNVEYIGAKAFKTKINDNTSTIERVFLLATNPTKAMLSTTRFELDETGDDYNEVASTTKIYVKKTSLDTYKREWHKMVYDQTKHHEVESSKNFVNQIEYKVPGVNITHKYGTFSREFDVDFSEYKKEKNSCDIGAFVAPVSGITQGPGDYGTSKYKVRMVSVDEKGGLAGEYGYVPAETGVLLKVLDVDSTPYGFFYTIGEKDNQTYN